MIFVFLCDQVTDFEFARQTEKKELMKDISKEISSEGAGNAPGTNLYNLCIFLLDMNYNSLQLAMIIHLTVKIYLVKLTPFNLNVKNMKRV